MVAFTKGAITGKVAGWSAIDEMIASGHNKK